MTKRRRISAAQIWVQLVAITSGKRQGRAEEAAWDELDLLCLEQESKVQADVTGVEGKLGGMRPLSCPISHSSP